MRSLTVPDSWGSDPREENKCHLPEGAPESKGGQFGFKDDCPGGGAATATAPAWKWAPQPTKLAISMYVKGGARYMNSGLRQAGKRARGEDVEPATSIYSKSPPDMNAVRVLDEHMQRNRLTKDTTLLRTIANRVVVGLEVGDVFQDDGYVSTTSESHLISYIRRDIGVNIEHYQSLLTILAPKGLGHINVNTEIGTDHEYAHQKEIILPRGLRFKVVSKGPNKLTLKVMQ